MFGGSSAPLNFASLPAWASEVVAVLVVVLVVHCVNGCNVSERTTTSASEYNAWRTIVELAGFDVPTSKNLPPSTCYRCLGIMMDLVKAPVWFASVIAEDRRGWFIELFVFILRIRRLPCGMASHLYRKLSWSLCTSEGRVGRSRLRPISRRATERNQIAFKKHHLGVGALLRAVFPY